ncbi:Gldg family protein [Candidatus Nephthysia bennettiae]|uniref:Gldg family protein n=1 Tax=Candidatus Nephthysia bennettiae TaxID=3127016 RepID=A0A934KB44_9BACT|nr:Gldg family protein [Candidatus Dormibacteraeota bacterium]MBJ7613341.1 Gldg family protein [Candidatus Dormibacteraeota bacterium]
MRGWDRLFGVLGAAAGVVLVFVGISIVVVEGRLVSAASYTLVAGVALLIAFVVLDPGAAADLVRSRRARFGSLSVLVSAVVIGILLVVNVLASRSSQAVDLTRSGLYTLSPKSALVAKRLDSDLQVTGFFRPDQSSTKNQVADLLSLYQQQSRFVKVQFADPDKSATQALSLGVTISGSLVLQYRNRTPVVLDVNSQTESDITGAVLRLEVNRTPMVCWAAGDGERSLTDADQTNGYSGAASLIKTSNYQYRDLLLSQEPGVPADCSLVAVVGVRQPLSELAVKSLQSYLSSGGKVFFAVDPWATDPRILTSVNSVFQPFGVGFSGALVVEGDAAHQAANNPTTPVAFDFGASPIAKDLARKYVFFVQPTPIVGEAASGYNSVDVVTTTDQSYSIAAQRSTADKRPGDKSGPFVLMRTLEQSQAGSGKKARLVLIGTSAIAANQALPPNAAGANPDLLLGTLDWLSGQEDLIGISPKPPAAEPLSLTAQQERLNYLLTLILLPLLIVVAGAAVYVRRRA